MKTTLLGFGIVYLAGAILLAFNTYFDIMPAMSVKSLAVLAFFLPGVVALIAHLEIVRLKKQLNDFLRKGNETGSNTN